jgi:hypothetical protein
MKLKFKTQACAESILDAAESNRVIPTCSTRSKLPDFSKRAVFPH